MDISVGHRLLERDYDKALEALDRSLALSPSSALAFCFSSIICVWIGEHAVAVEHAKLGIRLSPYDPLIYLPYVGLAYTHFFAGEFEEAASAASRASTANPRFSVPRYLPRLPLSASAGSKRPKWSATLCLSCSLVLR